MNLTSYYELRSRQRESRNQIAAKIPATYLLPKVTPEPHRQMITAQIRQPCPTMSRDRIVKDVPRPHTDNHGRDFALGEGDGLQADVTRHAVELRGLDDAIGRRRAMEDSAE